VAFTIYPDAATSALLGIAANTPVPLGPGAVMAAFAPLAGHVGPDPDAGNLPTTFIRISMSLPASAATPQVELRAVHPSMVEGPPQIITATSIAMPQALSDGVNGTPAASAYFNPPHVNNVYLLKVIIDIAGTTLKIRITNNTAVARDFVWVAADSAADSQQPWIHATPNALNFTALINQTSDETAQSIQITNRGTGPLSVTAVSPAIAAPYTISGLPVNVDPNPAAASNVVIGFNAPGAIGDTPLAGFTLTSTDPGPSFGTGHNNQFNLSATTSKLEIGMALDDSGSMSWGPGGEDPPNGGAANSRWSELRTAAKIFLDLLVAFGENRGTFGIVKFPGKQGFPINDVTTYDFDPLATAKNIPDLMTMGQTKNQLDLTNPFYQGTPMYYALERLLTAPSPYFAVDANSRDRNRRWILLMSDGAWNSSPDPRGWLPQLVSNKIKVFSAGYGTAKEVDYPTMEALSIGPQAFPGGMAQQVNSGNPNSATALADAFKTAIKAGLTSVSSPLDPTDVLHPGKTEARHSVIITPYDTKAVFMINWNTPDDDRLELQLITPTCELITPESARDGHFPGITFTNDIRHQIYIIDKSFLNNDADPSRPRHGTWQMIVLGRGLRERQGSEQYSYDVLIESALRMDVTTDRSTYFAGDTVSVSAKLTVVGVPITDAAVKLEVTMPGEGMDNWLAAIPISDGEYREAARMLAEKDASAIFIKAYAANLKGITFNGFTNKVTIPMTDPDNDGVYTAAFDQTSVPDGYKMYVTAVGATQGGVVFRRERSLEVTVGVRPAPGFTLIDILYDPVTATTGLISATVRVTPRDRFGNVVLIDPDTSQHIQLLATDADIDDRLTTRFDGTYTTRMTHKPGAKPSITVIAGGVPVVRDQVIAPIDQLLYVDEVLDYKKGLEGARGANRHTNPKDALGDIRQKPADIFVSLGAYGSLTVRLHGQDILAQGDDDVTVFVHPDADLRSYVVEGMPVGHHGRWVKVGKSAGITQSFSLKEVGLDSISAIRITDTSGRAKGPDLRPIETPGVSIRGVGVARAEQSGQGIVKEEKDEKEDGKDYGHDDSVVGPLLIGLGIGALIGLLVKR
jgi:hypothetical protein